MAALWLIIGLFLGRTTCSTLISASSELQLRDIVCLVCCADVVEICHELNLQGCAAAAGADLVTGFHHVVWMGDLNYRLEYGQQVGPSFFCCGDIVASFVVGTS
jgi:hypothetical protein